MRSEQDDPRRASGTRQLAASGPDGASAANFFLAVFRGKLAPRIYRVYPDADGLSFLGLGPPHPWIDLKWARMLDETHWTVRTARVIRKGVAMGIAAGSAAVGALGFAFRKAVLKDAPQALDLVLFVLTAAGMFVPGVLFVVTA